MSDDKGKQGQEAQGKTKLSEIRKGIHLTRIVDQSGSEPESPAAITANAEEGESVAAQGGGTRTRGSGGTHNPSAARTTRRCLCSGLCIDTRSRVAASEAGAVGAVRLYGPERTVWSDVLGASGTPLDNGQVQVAFLAAHARRQDH